MQIRPADAASPRLDPHLFRTDGAGLRGLFDTDVFLPVVADCFHDQPPFARADDLAAAPDVERRGGDDDGALDDDLHLNRKPDEQHFIADDDDDRRPDKRSGDASPPAR